MFFLLALTLAVASALPHQSKIELIPQLDGSLKSMTTEELEKSIESEPFYNPLTDIDFHLYTPLNPTVSHEIPLYDTLALRNSPFNPDWPTIFIVHGWGGDIKDGTIQLPKREYLAKGNYNVFGVDWSAGGSTANYYLARHRVNSTGSAIADYISFLVMTTGANPRNMLPVGFSLGGQVVGFVGRNVQRLLGIKLTAILGLDPAGPLFDYGKLDSHINSNDADYVQIVHTNGETLGMHGPLGHADFYVHGGKIQNGCGVDLFGSCSHVRAVEYWIESINSETKFIATQCENYENVTKKGCDFLDVKKDMFEEPIKPVKGIFFVDTNKKSPYALG